MKISYICHIWQLQYSHKGQGLSILQLLYVKPDMFLGLIHHQFLGTQSLVLLHLPGLTASLHKQLVCHMWQKVHLFMCSDFTNICKFIVSGLKWIYT